MPMQHSDDNVNHSAEYLDTVRLGAIQALGRFRRLLRGADSDAFVVLSRSQANAISDMLMFTEEHLLAMWDLTQRPVEHKIITRLNTEKLRIGPKSNITKEENPS